MSLTGRSFPAIICPRNTYQTELNMLRRLLLALLVVIAVASLSQHSQAGHSCRSRSVCDYMFGGFGRGLFGYGGGSGYAGYCPQPNYTQCGKRLN